MSQCVGRDEGWKQFYFEKMEEQPPERIKTNILELFERELEAELAFNNGNWAKAIDLLQKLIDEQKFKDAEKGWYLQEMARYAEPYDKIKSNELQVAAHRLNRFLLKPRTGMEVSRIIVSGERVANIISWVGQFSDKQELQVAVFEILDGLSFGVISERFEDSIHRLGVSLGFACERPDEEWKEGPDNLWALRDNEYLIIECKNEVKQSRAEIYKHETGQMNNSIAWFKRNYPGAKSQKVIIIPTRQLSSAAGFNDIVGVLRPKELGRLRKNVKQFFDFFKTVDFSSLNAESIQQQLGIHKLTTEHLLGEYVVPPMDP